MAENTLEGKNYELALRVAGVEKSQAVIESRLSDVWKSVERMEHNYSAHAQSDEDQLAKIKDQLIGLDREVIVQKSEINFIKATMVTIQESLSTLTTKMGDLEKKIVKITAGGGALLSALILFKDVLLKAFGLL